MRILKSFFAFLILFTYSNSYAQYTEVINSNRPGVSESAFSVGTNVVQFEAGTFSVKEEHVPLNYEVAGFGLDFSIRYGLLFEQLEISLDGVYQNDKITFNSASVPVERDRSNFRNFVAGVKYLVYDPYKTKEGEEEPKPNLYSYHANRKFQ